MPELDGSVVTVAGPMELSTHLQAFHNNALVTITLRCHRPDGASRLLQQELAHAGG